MCIKNEYQHPSASVFNLLWISSQFIVSSICIVLAVQQRSRAFDNCYQLVSNTGVHCNDVFFACTTKNSTTAIARGFNTSSAEQCINYQNALCDSGFYMLKMFLCATIPILVGMVFLIGKKMVPDKCYGRTTAQDDKTDDVYHRMRETEIVPGTPIP